MTNMSRFFGPDLSFSSSLHQGVALGPCMSLYVPSSLTPCLLCSFLATSASSTFVPNPAFLNPHFPIAHIAPNPMLPTIVGGAIKNPTPDANPPKAVAPIAATAAPTAAYFAHRTKRQKMKTPRKRRVRNNARVLKWTGRGAVGEDGLSMYLKFCRSERRAELERISALASVLGEGATVLEDAGTSGIGIGEAIVWFERCVGQLKCSP